MGAWDIKTLPTLLHRKKREEGRGKKRGAASVRFVQCFDVVYTHTCTMCNKLKDNIRTYNSTPTDTHTYMHIVIHDHVYFDKVMACHTTRY
jgi:hypothetical protein